MKNARNLPTAFRFTPEAKAALALISERDGRSMANMLEWLIRKHCEREAIGWPIAAEKAVAEETASKKKSQPKKN